MVHSYDFALYELRNHIKEKGRLIQMIALPLPNTQLLSGGECFVVGWGKAVKDSERTRDIKYAEVMAVELSDAKLSLISFSACEEAYGRKVDHSMICAGYRGERGENYSPKVL
ncbi:unnamed protein product [Notodromas monacha]|uniref:Peptidase S1 domain-containing protein n=1 Tax=Notodromas monacha TaxID=399045 RepID=A0A7R9C261_9CRUS|nr:unnamed protein product [Notodromas monacha]CAG0924730.1 unnamed protein product [Notodromas monacha]